MMTDLSGIIVLVLGFVDGLLFGLAIKKGIVSFVLLVIAFIISGYVGLSFIPKVSITNLFSTITSYVTTNLHTIASLIPIGNIGSLSLLVVLFAVGLGIGIWKG